MAQIDRIGFGQVEPNHLSAQKTGQIYAQLPATGIAQLEQGQFLKYNYAEGKAATTGDGEWMLVYVEEKHYDPRKPMRKDFCLKASDFTDKTIIPRLLKTNVGDIYTTNTFAKNAASDTDKVTGPELVEKDYLTVGSNGFLAKVEGGAKPEAGMVWQVVKVYTMPDGQAGVKIMRIQ